VKRFRQREVFDLGDNIDRQVQTQENRVVANGLNCSADVDRREQRLGE
jgi:hypothetical protein